MKVLALLVACLASTAYGGRMNLATEQHQNYSLAERQALQRVDRTMLNSHSLAASVQAAPPVRTSTMLVLPLLALSSSASAFVSPGLPQSNRQGLNIAVQPLADHQVTGTGQGHRLLNRTRFVDVQMLAGKESGDTNFNDALMNLAKIEELAQLRQRIQNADNLMSNAVREEDYGAAATFRDEARSLRTKDPSWLKSELQNKMSTAVQNNQFEEAAQYRDQLRTLKGYLPEYQLAGTWLGNIFQNAKPFTIGQSKGMFLLDLSYKGDTGDTLIGVDKEDKTAFEVDVAESYNDEVKPENIDNVYGLFKGSSEILAGGSLECKFYLIDDKTFIVQIGKEGGGRGDGELVPAGGGPRELVVAGEGQSRARGGGPGSGGGGGGGGGGGDGIFIIFKKAEVSALGGIRVL